ncbi:MAG: ATP-dependent helicase [Bacteroidaceae bacterium]|nr:ATP-dependent helicase [Bacteroidaceae bacterium]
MEYEMTIQRRAYYDARGFTILMACPGSGKTTSIVYKLHSLVKEFDEQSCKYSGVACLSFTNKACLELKQKYKEMHSESIGHPHLVSTIDSFITQYVVFPFWYLSDLCKVRPQIVNENEILKEIYHIHSLRNGKIKDYFVRELRDYKYLYYKYAPELANIQSNEFTWNNKIVTNESLKSYCKTSISYRMSKGLINSQDALYIGCYILKRHPKIANALTKRFKYIIVDEAQDTSLLQFCFMKMLKESGLKNIEFVGDLCQSIYEWRNAKPEILRKLSEKEEWHTLYLSENRRSNQRIINLYSLLKPTTQPSILSHQVDDLGLDIIVYRFDEGMQHEVIRDFLQIANKHKLKSKMILARGDTECKKLSNIPTPIKIWKSLIPYKLIEAKLDFEHNEIEKAIRKLRYVWGVTIYGKEKYTEIKEFIQRIEDDVQANAKLLTLIKNLPSLSLSFTAWTTETQTLLKNYFESTNEPDFEFVKRLAGYKKAQLIRENINKYFCNEHGEDKNYTIVQTIHSVKGTSLDAILLFLSEKNVSGQSISLSDFPNHGSIVDKMTERQRMIYVACSRAKQFLALAVPSAVPEDTIKQIFNGMNIKIKFQGIQG